jgi:hypothetical protein
MPPHRESGRFKHKTGRLRSASNSAGFAPKRTLSLCGANWSLCPNPDLHSAEAGCPAWGGKRSLAPPHFDELVGVGEINNTSARIAFTRRGQRE